MYRNIPYYLIENYAYKILKFQFQFTVEGECVGVLEAAPRTITDAVLTALVPTTSRKPPSLGRVEKKKRPRGQGKRATAYDSVDDIQWELHQAMGNIGIKFAFMPHSCYIPWMKHFPWRMLAFLPARIQQELPGDGANFPLWPAVVAHLDNKVPPEWYCMDRWNTKTPRGEFPPQTAAALEAWEAAVQAYRDTGARTIQPPPAEDSLLRLWNVVSPQGEFTYWAHFQRMFDAYVAEWQPGVYVAQNALSLEYLAFVDELCDANTLVLCPGDYVRSWIVRQGIIKATKHVRAIDEGHVDLRNRSHIIVLLAERISMTTWINLFLNLSRRYAAPAPASTTTTTTGPASTTTTSPATGSTTSSATAPVAATDDMFAPTAPAPTLTLIGDPDRELWMTEQGLPFHGFQQMCQLLQPQQQQLQLTWPVRHADDTPGWRWAAREYLLNDMPRPPQLTLCNDLDAVLRKFGTQPPYLVPPKCALLSLVPSVAHRLEDETLVAGVTHTAPVVIRGRMALGPFAFDHMPGPGEKIMLGDETVLLGWSDTLRRANVGAASTYLGLAVDTLYLVTTGKTPPEKVASMLPYANEALVLVVLPDE